ncbi:TetR/AcrR family transcriptional regulator [Aeromicrobium sp. P5_D10]
MSHTDLDHPEDPAIAGLRDRLAQAAIESFATKGFHATTTRSITDRAGVSASAMYVHYTSKEDLLYAISLAGHTGALELVRTRVNSSSSPTEQLTAVIQGLAMWHAERSTRARIVNYELAALTPPHLAEISEIRRQIEQELRSIVAAGIDSSEFPGQNPGITGLALLSLCVDISRWYRPDGDWSPAEVADHYSVLALRLVGATPEGRVSQPADRE